MRTVVVNTKPLNTSFDMDKPSYDAKKARSRNEHERRLTFYDPCEGEHYNELIKEMYSALTSDFVADEINKFFD